MRRIHGADPALPGRLHVDPVGKPVPLQLPNDLEIRGAVHHLGADHRRAMRHHNAINVAHTFHQPSDSTRILIRPKRDPSLQLQPLPVRDRREPVQVRRQQARLAHPSVAYDQHLGSGTCHAIPLKVRRNTPDAARQLSARAACPTIIAKPLPPPRRNPTPAPQSTQHTSCTTPPSPSGTLAPAHPPHPKAPHKCFPESS